MRREDVAKHRQPYLVPALGHPHVCALVAPPTPRRLVLGRAHELGFAEAHAALGRLQGTLDRIPNVDMVTRTLARREAVKSSQIEGTRTDLSQLLTYEATRSVTGLPPDVRVTERYVTALQHGLDRVRADGRPGLSLALLNELHAILMQDDDPDHPIGAYRVNQAWIGSTPRIEDATFVPAPPANIADCMNEMAASILQYEPREDEQAALSLLAQMAIAHAQFLVGHPMLSVQQAAQGLGVSVAAANGALNNLLKAGIVSLVNERQWGRVFQAAEVLERLDRAPGRPS